MGQHEYEQHKTAARFTHKNEFKETNRKTAKLDEAVRKNSVGQYSSLENYSGAGKIRYSDKIFSFQLTKK